MLSGTKLMSKAGVRMVPLVLLLITLIAVASVIFWYTTLEQKHAEKQFSKIAEQQIQTVVNTLAYQIADWQQRISSAAKSKQLIIALQQQDADAAALSVAETNLHIAFPQAKAVCVIPGLISEPEDNHCVDVTFATLNSLRQAYAHKSTLVAMMQAGTDKAHVLFVKEITDPEGKVLGAIALAIKPETIVNLVNKLYQGNGYLELQQGDQNALVIAHSGNSVAKTSSVAVSMPIAGSYWHVMYWPPSPQSVTSVLMLIIAILLAIAFFWLLNSFWQRVLLKQDVHVLRQQVDDLANNKLKPEYPILSRVIDPLALEIHNLVLPSRVAKNVTQPKMEQQVTVDEDSKPEPQTIEVSVDIFKAYDIRGIVGKQLSTDVMRILGQAIASEALDQGQSSLIVCRDGRLSSASYSQALAEGILSAGCNVTDIGELPTPLLYFACEQLGIASGVMVTGSHNPSDYNGLKIIIGGQTLSGEQVSGLYQRIHQGQLRTGRGQSASADVVSDYIAKVKQDITLTRPITVVIDCGNGVAGHLIPDLFEQLGCTVVPLFNDVDGHFPSHHPDPGNPDNLQDLIQAVHQHEAEMGIAFDGDGDRLGVVTAEGQIIWPDKLLVLLAQNVLSQHPGATVIYDVKSSRLLQDAIIRAGGEAMMSASGHSVIKRRMVETNALVAGEMSGHLFFKDRWNGADDALYAAARLLEFITADPLERSATEIFAALPKRVETPEIHLAMDESEARSFIQSLIELADFSGAEVTTIDGLRADYRNGWGLVRVSNTMPALTMRFEAGDEVTLSEIQQIFAQQMLQIKPALTLPF